MMNAHSVAQHVGSDHYSFCLLFPCIYIYLKRDDLFIAVDKVSYKANLFYPFVRFTNYGLQETFLRKGIIMFKNH